jgi:hypothetical protein
MGPILPAVWDMKKNFRQSQVGGPEKEMGYIPNQTTGYTPQEVSCTFG